MQPHIERTKYGSITIDGTCYTKDVKIGSDGTVKYWKNGHSKPVSDDAHVLSRDEVRELCSPSASRLIIGTGQHGSVHLSDEARDFLREAHCTVDVLYTPDAIDTWNHLGDGAAGLFHVTD